MMANRHPVLFAALAVLLLAALFAGSGDARDAALSALSDDARNDLIALYGSATARDADTADLVPIAHTDSNPYAINVFLEQEVEEWKIRRSLEMIRDAGFHWIKQQVLWYEIETPEKGLHYDTKNDLPDTWRKYDRIVDLAGQYGLRIIFRLDTSPDWARPGIEKHETPPRTFDHYGDFVFDVVSRYKGKVGHFQIWNEPNLADEWGGAQPNAAEYVRLLRIAYLRAKEANPDSVVIAAALAPTVEQSARATNDLTFLQQMYDAGAKQWFDILGVNAYGLRYSPDDRRLAEDSDVNFSRPVLVRELMVRNGDAGKAMWASEMGWNALPPDFAGDVLWGRVTREQQARYTVRAYQRIQEEWPWMGVAAVWHFRMVHDVNQRTPQYYFGIVGNDFEPYPAYDRVKALATAEPSLRAGFHQGSHWALSFQGEWREEPDASAALGKLMATDQAGSALRFSFYGSDLDLMVARRGDAGKLVVSIDDGPYGANRLPRDADGQAYVDLYSSRSLGQQWVAVARGLPWGRHDVRIATTTGERGGSTVAIEGVLVSGGPPNIPRAVVRGAFLLVALLGIGALWRLKLALHGRRALVIAGALSSRFVMAGARLFRSIAKGFAGTVRFARRSSRQDDGAYIWLQSHRSVLLPSAILVVLLSYFLRLYRVDAQSLWYDEGTSAALATRTIAAITADAAGDIHPPLYYYLLHFWTALAGTVEIALRFQSVVFGVLAVCLTYQLGRRLLGTEVGLVGALFAAVSPILVYYSQEARMYMQVTTLAAVSMYLFVALVVDGQRGHRRALWAAYFVVTTAMLYSHYFSFTIPLAQNIYVAITWLRSRPTSTLDRTSGAHLAGWLCSQLLLALTFAPWLALASGQIVAWPSISSPLGFGALLQRVFRAFSFGVGWDASYTPRREAAVAVLLLAAPVFVFVRARSRWRRQLLLIALYAGIPVIVMFLLSLQRPMYNAKFLLPAAPPFYIVLAAGAVGPWALARRLLRRPRLTRSPILKGAVLSALAVLLVAAFLYPATAALRAYYFDPKYARDDYRGLVSYIADNSRVDDAIVVNAPGQIEIFDYYYRGYLHRYALPRQRPLVEATTSADLEAVAKKHSDVWLVLWAVQESDPEAFVERWLDQRGTKSLDSSFGTVRLVRYALHSAPSTGFEGGFTDQPVDGAYSGERSIS